MHLVDEAIAPFTRERLTREKFAQKKRTSGPVNSTQAQHHSVLRENGLFRFAQNPSSFVRRLGRTRFLHDLSIFLSVDTRGAGQKQAGFRKCISKVARPIQVDAPVVLHLAAARTRAVNDDIELLTSG